MTERISYQAVKGALRRCAPLTESATRQCDLLLAAKQKMPCPRVRMRRKSRLGKICTEIGEAVFVNSAQSLDGSREKACWYGERASGGLLGGINTYLYANANPLTYTDPTGEVGIVGAGIGAAIEIGIQGYKNYRDGCDVFDPSNYDWWDVVVSAGVGAAGPGWLGVGKTTWRSGGAIKNLSEQAGRARTANRAQKIENRIDAHKDTIKDALITQGLFQGAKEAGKHINDSSNSCECRR